MFAIIDTKGANRIAIHIPHQGAEKTLPALAAMLEQNATFINKGWREASVVKPEMSISLGNSFSLEGDSETPDILIAESGAVISEDFELHTPEVRISYAKVVDCKNKEIDRLKVELASAKMARDQLQDRVNELSAASEANHD